GGHGPETPGKRLPDGSMKVYEFHTVVDRYVGDMLLENEGVQIIYTHASARDVPLIERTNKANQWDADAVISFHANATGNGWNDASGIETYAYTSKPAEAMKLAGNVQAALIKHTGRKDRGVKTADFHMLRETHMTAILCEC